jgi:hypothetical protein
LVSNVSPETVKYVFPFIFNNNLGFYPFQLVTLKVLFFKPISVKI